MTRTFSPTAFTKRRPFCGGFVFGVALDENAEVEVIVVRNRAAVSKVTEQSAAQFKNGCTSRPAKSDTKACMQFGFNLRSRSRFWNERIKPVPPEGPKGR